MTNNANNLIPTGPGPYYRKAFMPGWVAYVLRTNGVLIYSEPDASWKPVQDDGLWLGPVPMPGEWAPRELFDDLRYEVARLSPDPGTSAYDVVQDAQEWAEQNPAPEVTP